MDKESGHQWPADEWSGLARRSVSLGVQALMCRLNQGTGSFALTSRNLWEAARIKAGKELVRRTVEEHGRTMVEAQKTGALPPAWKASDCLTAAPQGAQESRVVRVYLGSDGVMAPMVTQAEKDKRRESLKAKGYKARRHKGADQSYKEIKIVAFYDQNQEHMHCLATRGDHRAAGVIMSREGRRLGLVEAKEKLAVVDGAPWIRSRIEAAKLDLDAVCLDFYHMSQHVHQARKEVFGEESPEGLAWVNTILETIKNKRFDAVWEALSSWRASLRSPRKRRVADALLQYLSQRQEMIQYPEFLQRGWQIGSGPTEGLCKTTTQRIKGRGRRWNAVNAEGMMAVDTTEQSGLWNAYWRLALLPAA
jgi:hypothetical protein